VDENEYKMFEELFATRGWQEVVSEAEDAVEARKEQLTAANSIDEVRFLQGEIRQLRILASMETAIDLKRRMEAEHADVELIRAE
jgi:hypothetical protein